MSARTIAVSLIALLATTAIAQSASASAENCQVQNGALICTVLGEQYRATSDVDLSNPPSSYSTCEALSETTLDCVGVDSNGLPISAVLTAVNASGGNASAESAAPSTTKGAPASSTTDNSKSSMMMSSTAAMNTAAASSSTAPSETSSAPNAGVTLGSENALSLAALMGAVVVMV